VALSNRSHGWPVAAEAVSKVMLADVPDDPGQPDRPCATGAPAQAVIVASMPTRIQLPPFGEEVGKPRSRLL
jgi:hypothetical protein